MILESIARPRVWSKREGVQRRKEMQAEIDGCTRANAAG